jgi:hypothetical protein
LVEGECRTGQMLVHNSVMDVSNWVHSKINQCGKEEGIYAAQHFLAFQRHVGDVDPDTNCR